jgi:hypothetical protein
MYQKFSRFLFLLLPVALLTSACASDDITAPSDGSEVLRIAPEKGFTLLLTDAPGDFVAAVVTIERVYLQGQGGRVDLVTTPITVNLPSLQNEVATLVAGLDVPAGSYNQLRIVISGAYIEVEQEGGGTKVFASSPTYSGLPSGTQVDGTLVMPSFSESGFKIDLPGGQLEVGEGQTIVMIDFDVKESFGHEAGKSGRWILQPSIKATNVTFGGNVLAQLQLGTDVTLPTIGDQAITLASFTAELTPVGGGTARTVVFTDANNDGIFEALFKGLPPGDYTLTLVGPAGLLATFEPTLPLTVTVSQNQTTTETITISSAAAASTINATLALGTGVTLPMVGGAQVTLGQFRAQLTPTGGSAVVANFTDANNDGTWEVSFPNLAAGEYSLTILPPAGVNATFNPTLPIAITLAAGATSTHAISVTAATAS